jgi:predicted AlkP superfamily pyrophosphatase or phosphodiesterase
MKKVFFYLLFGLVCFSAYSQRVTTVDRPKLVVGVVVDQMRYDYLTRFYERYGEDGFRRILREGFNCENAHFNYIPTQTAVGHASVYTGTTGSTHGIIANYWYDKFLKEWIYCVDDFNYEAVGTDEVNEQKSPYRLLTTTVTDELRLAQNMNGKTIAIGLKDRSAVLPGGHTSNGSYWFVGKEEGKFVTSSFYMDELPKWVNDFNKNGLVDDYMKKKWETLYPIKTYKESIEDDNAYEGLFIGEEKPVFPHDLKKLAKDNAHYDLIKSSPFGNTLLVEFAKEAIKNEKLGQGDFTDFLAISFSSPDYIGHQFGVDSKEIQDTYLRLDKDLADLLSYLDKKIGEGNYTLFLTADHGAVAVPAYLKSKKIPAGYFNSGALRAYIDELAVSYFGAADIIENVSNYQIFLDKNKLKELKLDASLVAEKLAGDLINYEGIHKVITAKTLQNTEFSKGILNHLQNGYNQKLSGDVMMIPNPATSSYGETGSTHGSGYSYDTHVPIMFFGKGIENGRSRKKVEIIDIAPTLSNLLQIEFPNGNQGRVIEEVLR